MLTFEDFAALGTHLHELTQKTYSLLCSYIDQIKLMR